MILGILYLNAGLSLASGELLCGEGTHEQEGQCVPEFFYNESFWLSVGVIVAAGGVSIAAVITVLDRKRDMRRRVQDLIQSYTDDFRKISEQERNLKTKLDCFLYCEQYLDALEMIATLSIKTELKKEVSDYFSNNFSYGIHLWRWYMEKAVNFKNEDLKTLWNLPYGNQPRNVDEATKKYLENERWMDFREWCHTPPENTMLKMDLPKFQKQNLPYAKKYHILPDVMETSDFDDIPEEDGLTKGELIQLIRGFGTDIGKLADDERKLKSDIDCSVYAEKYLDILEQISSLYRKQVIPKRAADYFENKFTYGINLWEWYSNKVLNLNPEEITRLWNHSTEIIDSKNFDEQNKRYLENERWREFRWWCKKNNFQQFEENPENPLILPDRMWEYGKNDENDSD